MSHNKTLFSIGLSAAALIGTLTLSHGQAQAATTGTTTYEGGATTVWSSPAFSTPTRYLTHGQQVNIIDSKTVNGTTWFEVGQNEWVPSIYMQSANDTTATSTAAPANTATAVGSVKVNYTAGSTTVWTGVDSGKAAAYLAPGETAQYSETSTGNGYTWYHITSGWVPSKYVSVVGANTQPTTQQTQTAQPAQQQQAQPAVQQQAAQPSQQQNTQQQTNTYSANTQQNSTASTNTVSSASATVKVTFYDPASLGSNMGYNGVAANLAKYPKGTRLKITLADGTVLHRVVNDTGTFVSSNPNQIDLAWPNSSVPSYGVTTASVSVE